MTIQVLMPQLGESVIEGTVAKWLIAAGQPVQQSEPLLQITTDKVDTELPAPASGILLEILVEEGQTVPKGTVLAVIGGHRDPGSGSQEIRTGRLRRHWVSSRPWSAVSPLNSASISTQVIGTGAGGRITKKDVLAYVAAPTPREPLPVTESPVPSHLSAPRTPVRGQPDNPALSDAARHRPSHDPQRADCAAGDHGHGGRYDARRGRARAAARRIRAPGRQS